QRTATSSPSPRSRAERGDEWNRASADAGDVGSLASFRSRHHVELHTLSFLQRLEAAALDRGKVHEDILARLVTDEPEPFGLIEPFHRALLAPADRLSRRAGWSGRARAASRRRSSLRLVAILAIHRPARDRLERP